MKMSSLEKLKQVLNHYSSEELYQCLSSYPAITGVSIRDYLHTTKFYFIQLEDAWYIDKKNTQQSNDSYYEIDGLLNMGFAA